MSGCRFDGPGPKIISVLLSCFWVSGRVAQAFREAQKEWTQARVPLDWAKTMNNLGDALRLLGQRESGTSRLEEAVIAYRGLWRKEPAIGCRSIGP